jgi:hypothetical protein
VTDVADVADAAVSAAAAAAGRNLNLTSRLFSLHEG